jgi:osmotically-inducible protein OsmY
MTLLGAEPGRQSGGMTILWSSPDRDLQLAVEEELEWTPAIDASRVGVAVIGGAVSLFGDVSSFPQKEAAVKAALRIRGVLAVADEIVVHTQWGAGTRDDIDIAREAGATLNRSVLIPKGSVRASVEDGIVTLIGEVPWHYQREAIHHAISVLPGVVLVQDEVTIAPAIAMVSPDQARTKITAALVRNARLDAERIHTDVVGTRVTLTGEVSSWQERRQADQAAWAAPGVTVVDNQLTVAF